jgi:hypothetical protein
MSAVIFWQPEGHRAPGRHSPAKKGKYTLMLRLALALVPRSLRKKRSAAHFLFMASEHKSRQLF